MGMFKNVSFKTIMSAVLRLLDERVLDKDLQIVGIKMLRKIVEVENKERTEPCADWPNDENMEKLKKRIEKKQ